MKLLDGIKATGTQKFRSSDDNGATIEITLHYLPAAQIWTADITCGTFTLCGQRLCTHLNLLQQYGKIIAFGMAITTTDGGEPFLINDFSTGRCQMRILTSAEVTDIEQYYKDLKDA